MRKLGVRLSLNPKKVRVLIKKLAQYSNDAVAMVNHPAFQAHKEEPELTVYIQFISFNALKYYE
jgi:hypothetical protein